MTDSYAKILKMMKKTETKSALKLATMKSATSFELNGMTFSKDDYLRLQTDVKADTETYHAATLKAGDTVLVYQLDDTQFILFGKVG